LDLSIYVHYQIWEYIGLDNQVYTPKFRGAFRIDQSKNISMNIKLVMSEKDDEDSNMKVKKDDVSRKRKET